ncbi:MAG: hypothetical protein PHT59_02405 [Candidatus Omnitrophica bacterium]|nr:hypothetical protein [Candidatus Omnitrophota bacterium]
MEAQKDFYQVVEQIFGRDPRYKPDCYEFVMQALEHTQKKLKIEGHVSGRQLLDGIRDFALKEYGPMAKTVLKHWGVSNTADFGNIVFNMIEQQLLSKTDQDRLADFENVFDFEEAFKHIVKDLSL